MKGFDGYKLYKLHAVKERLALAVNTIVERHRTAGDVLTWRLVHQIESEALDMLMQSRDLDVEYIRMVRSSRWGYVPRVDEPADLETHDELPVALTLIQHAYHTSH
ncbi:DUF2471 family protein [Noviherbaspirillum cavernae]|uniref:DUF2471 family protein n=1 Tax=Noviherbaspirillum cavernae TaxID=2320862 RepID=A0A418WUT5_9BURK|nr:DUF2471 family protein [Noviherbaspirillum cavernae]RJF96464.1 DUF2471 family protein [Noviherbaspirillum cavernae]